MALVTGIRHAQIDREVRTRSSHTVIATLVYDHVYSRRHMTIDALSTSRTNVVEMMLRRVVSRRMTLSAETVALRAGERTVWLMAIAAGNSRMEHPALDEGSVLVDFIFDLPVRKIEIGIKQGDSVVIAHRLPMNIVLVELASSRMAPRTHLNLVL